MSRQALKRTSPLRLTTGRSRCVYLSRVTCHKLGVTCTASNEASCRFYNHGEGLWNLRKGSFEALVTCHVSRVTCHVSCPVFTSRCSPGSARCSTGTPWTSPASQPSSPGGIVYVDRCRIVEFIDILTDLVIIEISLPWSPTRPCRIKWRYGNFLFQAQS